MVLLPPDARRRRAARAAGLRARAPRLVLVPLALVLAWPLDGAGVHELSEWFAARLDAVFVERLEPASLATMLGSIGEVALLVFAGATVLALVLALARGRARLDPPLLPTRSQPSSLLRVALLGLAVVIVARLVALPLLAAAARGVDASATAMLVLWCAWLRRALLGLVAAAALVGVIEYLCSARRLWLALHLDRESARRARERPSPRPFSRTST